MASKIEESEAFEKLRTFVARTLPSARLRWHDGAEPPDFDLFIDDIEYAVEVTQLRKLFQIGQARLPMRAIGRELESFVRRAEAALVASGGFVGSYAVVVPRPIPDLRLREPELIELIRAGAQELQLAPLQAKTMLLRVDRRQCSLLKLAEQGCSLTLYGPTDSQ